MRKLFFLLLALPLVSLAQNKNLLSTSRYFPKSGMWQKFETALSAHAKKYHKDDFRWRVYSIETGPDAGGYMVVEGPNNWASVDGRGDLGAAHMADWETTINIHLQDKSTSIYYEYREDFSSGPMVQMADKISIHHLFPNPGYRGDVMQYLLEPNKKLHQADGMNVAVYEAALSGMPQFVTVTRYVSGLKQRDEANPVPFVERFKKANGGDASWNKWLEVYKSAIRNQWTELLHYKPTLGSN